MRGVSHDIAGTQSELGGVERWFVVRGVPHFVADHSPTRVVLRRAAPILVAYVAVTLLMTASFTWSIELNLLAVGGAALVVLAAWAVVNLFRRRRLLALPDRFGWVEIAAFLLIPALPPLLIGFQVSDALIALMESAIFLGVVYVATSYGLIGSLAWALRRTAAQLGSLGRLLTRALPLLMVFIAFTFLSSTTWQVTAALGWQAILTVVVFFLALSLAFLIGRIAPEVRRLVSAERPWTETVNAVEGTPAAPLLPHVADAHAPDVPLRWHEWVNIGTLVAFGQGVQIVLVTFAVQIALVLFGLLLVPASIQEEWIGRPVTPLIVTEVGTETIALTFELLVVSLILGAFSGLYFTVSALSDATYRAEFFSDADRELSQVLSVRTVYHAARLERPSVEAAAVEVSPQAVA